ncbi:MAG: KUP/HAK/KT family potassium transporter [Spirochaetes bacterium]|nr:KUP/HAK/KT family potassium transporter [Spirochaetota bacterium]
METPARKTLLPLSVGALGVVFGDIGTSPLYTLRECFSPQHGLSYTFPDVAGILSLVFWALTLVVTVKYVTFIMRADNQGEGGILSLLALIIGNRDIKKTVFPIVVVGLTGMSLLLAEGMITPAITVLSAVEGLKMAASGMQPFIIPISIIILIALFFIQRRGTGFIGVIFGPLMIVWFLSIAALGINSIIKSPEILWAVNPWFAMQFFMTHKIAGVLVLGAVVLAITGAEALYADLGHFGKSPIRLAWLALVFPSLVLNYFGQGAAVLRHGEAAVANPFFYIAPSWALFPMIAIATIAAVIASQALISGAFSLVQQAMQLGYVPKMKIIHTSYATHGQIYMPVINYFLMFACIFLVMFFRSSSNLASAYGISVMGTMTCTSILFFIMSRQVWRWPLALSMVICMVFFVVDGTFLSANANKVMSGGWFPVVVAIVFFTVMQTWKRGSTEIHRIMSAGSVPFDNFLNGLAHKQYAVTRIPGTAVFMIGNPKNKLSVLLHHLKHNKSLHESVILLSFAFDKVPSVARSERLSIVRHIEGFCEIRARFGYMESPRIDEVIELCNENGFTLNVYQLSFFVGRISLSVSEKPGSGNWPRRLFRFMHRNAESAIDYFGIPPGRVIEVGTQIEL